MLHIINLLLPHLTQGKPLPPHTHTYTPPPPPPPPPPSASRIGLCEDLFRRNARRFSSVKKAEKKETKRYVM